jgi:hypothetical protein
MMMVPFEHNQPIERYRRLHQQSVAQFAAFLGIPEPLYIRLVVGDRDIPVATQRQIARQLAVPPWLINECIPPPTEEDRSRLAASLAAGRAEGYYRHDVEHDTWEGPIFFEDVVSDSSTPPFEHSCLADALIRLVDVHADGTDPDYPRLRDAIESRIRTNLDLGSEVPFDALAWAHAIRDAAITPVRRVDGPPRAS